MTKALEMFKTIANKVDDFIYFGIIALLIYYRTITFSDSLYYRTSLLILFAVIYTYICIKDKHNRLFTLLYYNKILFSILTACIILFLYNGARNELFFTYVGYKQLLICFITLILILFMGFKGNTNIINFKKQDKIFAYILSVLYLSAFIQSSYFIHINDYLDKYLFPYTITLIMVLITLYLLIKFIQHHTLKETAIYLISSYLIIYFFTFLEPYYYFYLMIVLWAGYIFFNIKFNEYLKPIRVILFIVFSIWLIYYPFSYHSLCYFVSLDPQYNCIPENITSSITTIHNPERINELIPKICQNKASSESFNKRRRIWDYIQEKRKEDTDFPYDDSSYFFDTESKRYKELSAELQKVDIEKQEFLHKCETKYFGYRYDFTIQGVDMEFWNNVDDKILVKEFSHKNEKGRISYEVYNFYEKDTGMLLYSGKTGTKFNSFIYELGLSGNYFPFPNIMIINMYF